jgi:ABC-2 type transport system permease protein
MSIANVLVLLKRYLRLGPRTPIVLWAIVLPVFFTILFTLVFGSLFEPEPRLGIVDEDSSAITTAAQELDGFDVRIYTDESELLADVEGNNLDAGLILPAGFDDAVRAGERPLLDLRVGGESLASNRLVIAVTVLDLIRSESGLDEPVNVEVVSFGEDGLDLSTRMLPLLVMFTVAIAGAFVTAASLVEEKERKTLDAVVATPVTITDVLVAKGIFGAILGIVAGVMTLLLNAAFGSSPLLIVVGILVGAVMMAEIGLIIGSWAPDTNTLFAVWKGGAIVLFFPVLFPIWPDLPQWIAKLGPAYYFLDPIFQVSTGLAAPADVWWELAVGAGMCVALVPLVVWSGARLERRLATGKIEKATEEALEPATV